MDVVTTSGVGLGGNPQVGLLLERVLGRSKTDDVAIGKLVALLIAKRGEGSQVPGNDVLGLVSRDSNGKMVEHCSGLWEEGEKEREIEYRADYELY